MSNNNNSNQQQQQFKLILLASLGGAVAGAAISYFLLGGKNNTNKDNNSDKLTNTATTSSGNNINTSTSSKQQTQNQTNTTVDNIQQANNQTATTLLRYLSEVVHKAAREAVSSSSSNNNNNNGSGQQYSPPSTPSSSAKRGNNTRFADAEDLDALDASGGATSASSSSNNNNNPMIRFPQDISQNHPLSKVAKAAAENIQTIMLKMAQNQPSSLQKSTSASHLPHLVTFSTQGATTTNNNNNNNNNNTSDDKIDLNDDSLNDLTTEQKQQERNNNNNTSSSSTKNKIKKTLSFRDDTKQNNNNDNSNNKSKTASRSTSPGVRHNTAKNTHIDSTLATYGSFRKQASTTHDLSSSSSSARAQKYEQTKDRMVTRSIRRLREQSARLLSKNGRRTSILSPLVPSASSASATAATFDSATTQHKESGNQNKNSNNNNLSQQHHQHTINVYKYFALAIRSILRCASSDPVGVARILAEALRGLLHADRCTVFVVDEETETLTATIEKSSSDDDKTTTVSLSFGEGFAGKCAQNQKPIIVNNAYENENFNANVDEVSGYVTKTVLTVPLIFEGSLLAVVQLLNKLDDDEEEHDESADKNNTKPQQNSSSLPSFGEGDLELFQAFVAVSGVVIRDALLKPEVDRLKISNKMMGEVCANLVTANLHDQVNTATAVADGLRRCTPGATSCSIIKVDFVKAALEELVEQHSSEGFGRYTSAGFTGSNSPQSNSRSSSPGQNNNNFNNNFKFGRATSKNNNNNNNQYFANARSPPRNSYDSAAGDDAVALMAASSATMKPPTHQQQRDRSPPGASHDIFNPLEGSSNLNDNNNTSNNQTAGEDSAANAANGSNFNRQHLASQLARRNSITTVNSLPLQHCPSANYEVIAQSVVTSHNHHHQNNYHQSSSSSSSSCPLYSHFVIEVLNGIVAGAVRPIYGGQVDNNNTNSQISSTTNNSTPQATPPPLNNSNNKPPLVDFVYCFPVVPFEDELDGCWIVQLIIKAEGSSSVLASKNDATTAKPPIFKEDSGLLESSLSLERGDQLFPISGFSEDDEDDEGNSRGLFGGDIIPRAEDLSTHFILGSIEWLLPLSEAVARNSILLSSRDLQNEQFQRIGKILEKVASDQSRFSDPSKTLEYVAREIEGICNWQSHAFFFQAVSGTTQERLKMFHRVLPLPSAGGGSSNPNNLLHHNHSHFQSHADLTSFSSNSNNNMLLSNTSTSLLNATTHSFGTFGSANNNNSSTTKYFIEPVLLGDGVTGHGSATREPTFFPPGTVFAQHLCGEFGEFGKVNPSNSPTNSTTNNNIAAQLLNASDVDDDNADGDGENANEKLLSSCIISESTSALVIPLMHKSVLLGAITILDPHPQLFAKYVPNGISGEVRDQTPEQWRMQLEMFDFLCSVARFTLRAASVVKEVIRESTNSVSAYKLEDEFSRRKGKSISGSSPQQHGDANNNNNNTTTPSKMQQSQRHSTFHASFKNDDGTFFESDEEDEVAEQDDDKNNTDEAGGQQMNNNKRKKRLLTVKSVQTAVVDEEFYDLALSSNSFPIWKFHDGEQPAAALPKLLLHLFKNLNIDCDEDENDKEKEKKNILEELNVDEQKLLLTIGHALSMYRDASEVPYHNVFHAFDVTQTCYRLLRLSGLMKVFSSLEKFALILSCVFHDIDHNGLNNNYHIKAETQIGIMGKLSGQRAVLELHHCQTALRIINNAGLFARNNTNNNNTGSGSPSPVQKQKLQEQDEQAKKITSILFSNILATDMASHKEIMTMVDDTLLDEDDDESIFEGSNEAHRELAMRALLKMADISNPSKEFSTGRRWGLAVTEEFFKQGDVERTEGRDISPMCDREAKTDLAKSQIGFIQFMVKPYYCLCAKVFPSLQVMVDNLNSNLERWQKVATAYSK